jgi:tripartite-type tricarboxylate transporter receptor subunit TctC
MTRSMPRALCGGLLVLCAALGMASEVRAQEFPSRTIKLLVGFPAGGPSDVPARLIAERMQTALGQSVVVENKTGAAGIIIAGRAGAVCWFCHVGVRRL